MAPLAAPLTLYPAIDLKAGQCVRLLHGDMAQDTVYNDDPGDQARAFEDAGFDWLHVVDLDGAFSGKAENRRAVETIVAASGAKKQLGGGVRDMAAVEGWLAAGIDRVILGTAAVKDPQFVRDAATAFPGRIVVGLDARDGRVRTDGWAGDTDHRVQDLAKAFEDAGVSAVIYTDISRDGALAGVNVAATAALAAAVSIPIVASGGVAGADDVGALARAHPNIEGVVIGRALYDGSLDISAARRAAERR